MWDATTSAVVSTMGALSQRGEVRAHNMANAETPGFRARQVEFEDQLREAIDRGDPASLDTDTIHAPTPVDGMGNSVEVETEMVESMQDGLLRQAMVNGFNFKTGNMRAAITGQR